MNAKNKLKNYSFKLYCSVPENCRLVKYNYFTGKYYTCGEDKKKKKPSGFKVEFRPWVSSKIIDITDVNESFHDITCKSKEGYDVTVDVDFVRSIIDTTAYEVNSSDANVILENKLEAILRTFIASKTYSELSEVELNLLNPKYSWIYASLESIRVQYGVDIKSLFLKNVRIPQELTVHFQKEAVQSLENQRLLSAAQGKREAAKIDLETAKTLAQSKTLEEKVSVAVAKELANIKGLNPEQTQQIIYAYMITRNSKENPNQIFTIGNSNGVASDMATAAMTYGLVNNTNNGNNLPKQTFDESAQIDSYGSSNHDVSLGDNPFDENVTLRRRRVNR